MCVIFLMQQLVLNNFNKPLQHVRLMAKLLQSMFPSIKVEKVRAFFPHNPAALRARVHVCVCVCVRVCVCVSVCVCVRERE